MEAQFKYIEQKSNEDMYVICPLLFWDAMLDVFGLERGPKWDTNRLNSHPHKEDAEYANI